MKKTKILTKEELLKQIQPILNWGTLTEEEKENSDWLQQMIMSKKHTTIYEVCDSYFHTLLFLEVHKDLFEKLEDYELCAQLRDCEQIEHNEHLQILQYLFAGDQQEDIIKLEDVERKVKGMIEKLNEN